MTEQERANRYEYVRRTVYRCPKQPDRYAFRERDIRTRLVAHGELSPEQFDSVLGALAQNADAVRGSGWITPVVDDVWLRDAIEYVADRAEDPREFVANANQYLTDDE
jgi:hypothetical protein